MTSWIKRSWCVGF